MRSCISLRALSHEFLHLWDARLKSTFGSKAEVIATASQPIQNSLSLSLSFFLSLPSSRRFLYENLAIPICVPHNGIHKLAVEAAEQQQKSKTHKL